MATPKKRPPTKKTAAKTPAKPPSSRGTKVRLEAWERREDESDQAWAAFVTYRNMGSQRSIAKVAQDLGKSRPLISGWSSRHSWVIRVQAYDAEEDRLWRLEQAEARREAARHHYDLGNAALVKFGNFLDTIADHELELEPAVYTKLAEVGLKLVRDGIGADPGTPGAVRGNGPVGVPRHAPGGAPVSPGVTAAGQLPDEDRRTRLLMLQREIASRLEDEPVPEGEAEPDPDDPYAED